MSAFITMVFHEISDQDFTGVDVLVKDEDGAVVARYRNYDPVEYCGAHSCVKCDKCVDKKPCKSGKSCTTPNRCEGCSRIEGIYANQEEEFELPDVDTARRMFEQSSKYYEVG